MTLLHPGPVSTPRQRPATAASPFLKWAGGKTQLLPQLLPRLPGGQTGLPARFERYFEPFLGSAALFFALQPTRAVLSDANPRLMAVYQALQRDPEPVIAALARFRNERDCYYEARGWRHDELPQAQAAARIIFLNKTCYNGLYRENRRGEFNVPFGRYKNPRICDAANLRAVHRALEGVVLRCQDFAEALDDTLPGDFVYLDPPYHPLSATASFTGYHRDGFGVEEQRRLAAAVRELDRRGVRFMLSNSDTPLIRELYAGYPACRVEARRAINSKAERRGKVAELIVRNYGEQAPVTVVMGAVADGG